MSKTVDEAIEEAKMTEEELANKSKLSYVETQIDEMNAIIRRNEVDIYINENVDWTEDESLEAQNKIREHKKLNERLEKAVGALKKLQKELQ